VTIFPPKNFKTSALLLPKPAGTAAPQSAGYGTVTDRAAGKSICVFQQINKSQWSLPI